MKLEDITLESLVDKIKSKVDFVLIIEEVHGSLFAITDDPSETIQILVKKISRLEHISSNMVNLDIAYFFNEDKPKTKEAIGLASGSKPVLMYWEKGKPSFSVTIEEIISILQG